MRTQTLLLAILSVSDLAHAQDGAAPPAPAPVVATEMQPSFQAAASVEALKAPALVAGIRTMPTEVMFYDWWECRVDWNQYCNASKPFDAWPGWQVCKAIYTLDATNNGITTGPSNAPDAFFTLDPLDPPSFKRVTISFHAEGNKQFFNKKGALMRLNRVGLSLLPGNASYSDRAAAECVLPTPP